MYVDSHASARVDVRARAIQNVYFQLARAILSHNVCYGKQRAARLLCVCVCDNESRGI